MNTLTLKLLISAMFIGGLALSAYQYGKIVTVKQYEPTLAALQATLDQAAQTAKAEQAKHKETQDAVEKSNNANIATIRARYDRLLRNAKGNSSAVATPASTSGADGASSEQTIAGCSAEFEQACILDANKVTQWQEWARRNAIPIGN